MCGIVGYIGKQEASSILLDGLKRLEYRGYDSSGIAIVNNKELKLVRSAGKLTNLENILKKSPIEGTVAVGHTRWATHGKPSEENSHPHTDCNRRLVVVHNGIIENYMSIKRKLQHEGHTFRSETDTEVLAHLIEKYYKKGTLLKAVQRALKDVRGSYALGVLSADEPDKIIAARKDSPLIIGLGRDEFFIASDVPAILPYTQRVIYLDDEEIAVLTIKGVEVFSSNNKCLIKDTSLITWDPFMAEKGGYKHFMLKEINEQPRVIQDTLRGRLSPDKGEVYLEEVGLTNKEIQSIKRVTIIACGTSYHAGLVGKYVIEHLLKIPCEVDIGSEFRYRDPLIFKGDLVIVITQSGETADTLAALREAKSKGAHIIAICNVVGSSVTREADGVIYTHAGPEIGVASTKAFTSQLVAIYLLALYLGRKTSKVTPSTAKEIISALRLIPHQVEDILKDEKDIVHCAQALFKKIDFLYLGRHVNYPIALEGALKLKEISYIHAEGYPAGEMKHGPIALIDENMPVLAIATKDKVYEKVLSNIEEVKSRGGIVIALGNKGSKELEKKADYLLLIPKTMEMLTPLLAVIPLQLLAYHIAVLRGCDVDQPRNLAKSVTVE